MSEDQSPYTKSMYVMEEAYNLCKKQPLTEQQKWVKIGWQWTRKLNKIVRHHPTLSMGEKLKIQNVIGLLQSLIEKLPKKYYKSGRMINLNE